MKNWKNVTNCMAYVKNVSKLKMIITGVSHVLPSIFKNWTSDVDKFIQKAQLKAKN